MMKKIVSLSVPSAVVLLLALYVWVSPANVAETSANVYIADIEKPEDLIGVWVNSGEDQSTESVTWDFGSETLLITVHGHGEKRDEKVMFQWMFWNTNEIRVINAKHAVQTWYLTPSESGLEIRREGAHNTASIKKIS